jgi:hypothetical protein
MSGDGDGASGFAEYRDTVGVSREFSNVLANPEESGTLVKDTQVQGVFLSEFLRSEETQSANTIVMMKGIRMRDDVGLVLV